MKLRFGLEETYKTPTLIKYVTCYLYVGIGTKPIIPYP